MTTKATSYLKDLGVFGFDRVNGCQEARFSGF